MRDTIKFWFLLILLYCVKTSAEESDWIDELCDLYSFEELETGSQEEIMEHFETLHSCPLNINKATVSELEDLFFLDNNQIEEIHAYIYLHGKMVSLGELQLVPGLDYKTRRLLSHFVYAGPVGTEKQNYTLKDVFEYSKQEINSKFQIPLYQVAGFKDYSEDVLERYPGKAYLGVPFSHSIRFSLKYRDKLNMGFTAEQDMGEPFFGRNREGYDFYSYYFNLQNHGKLKNLVIGKLKVGIGAGLIFNSGFSLGKNFSSVTLNKSSKPFRPHSSISETAYFRGVGLTYNLYGYHDLSILVSNTNLDANLSEGEITSFKTDGYHRTVTEWSKKNCVTEHTAAANWNWFHNGIKAGATFAWEHLSSPIAKSEALHKRYSLYGDNFSYLGIDYAVKRSKFMVSGETALTLGAGMATIHTLDLKRVKGYDLRVSYRFYGHNYESRHSGGFSEGKISNEMGLYIGVSRSLRNCSITAYLDFFKFPKPTYSASLPSKGLDSKVVIDMTKKRNSTKNFSMRYKMKQIDSGSKDILEWDKSLRLKARHSLLFLHDWENRLQADVVLKGTGLQDIEKGFSLSNAVTFTPHANFSITSGMAAFITDSFNSSVSVYEKGMRYSLNYVSLYGKGIRGFFLFKYKFGRLLLTAKVQSHSYFDREQIGSSQQLTDSSHKEDIHIQLNYKF